MKLLILDNYDSFTYNLAHLVSKVSTIPYDVIRNDKISLNDVQAYDKILLSPGPGLPKDAGIMPELITHYGSKKPILGVCLGLQAIGEAYGARLKNLDQVYHGVSTPVCISEPDLLFEHCPKRFSAGRYHSWVIDPGHLPGTLSVTATDEDGHIMAIRHRHYPVRGVQFHPESVLSEYGETLLRNWLNADSVITY